ncbi:MAG: hypothetical protein E7390_09425 [Ruminococcaceae bacterium]|nr:hypothetical protein [Oscillospiraceae bacterium]
MEGIVSAIIQAVATVLAAIIGVSYAGKIVKKTTEAHFFNYMDEKHDSHKFMRKAKSSITIIANCGDEFLKKFYSNLMQYVKKGVQINFLLLDMDNYAYMDKYTTGKNNADYDALETSLHLLSKLKRENPDKITIKVFHSVLTASYIGIDLEQNLLDNTWPSTALIQVMSYQFNTRPGKSPITYVSPQAKEQFQTIVDSIFAIWDCGDIVDLDEYLEQVIKHMEKVKL